MIRRILSAILALALAAIFAFPVSAHPGRTDSSGGHTNHSTGEYHYHHGYSAHQHTGGVCPYDFDDKSGQSSGSSSYSSYSSIISSTSTSELRRQLEAAEEDLAAADQELHDLQNKQEKGFRWRNIVIIILGIAVVWIGVSLRSVHQELKQAKTECHSLRNDNTDLNRELSQTVTSLSACTKERNGLQARLDELTQTYERAAEQLTIARKQLDNFRLLAVNDEPASTALLDQLREAEKKAEQCEEFIRSFGPDAEIFFAQPDASARLSRMMADYLTLLYDASADYLDQKERPAHVEAKRIRELKAETQHWISRALRAEYELERLTRPAK